MYSREEAKKLRESFWIAFGKSYPRKWILYQTKIKGLAFKFHFDSKKAIVALDISTSDLEQRMLLWEKLLRLQHLLVSEYLPTAVFEDTHFLEQGKEVSRIYIVNEGVSIHNKASWQETMIFFNENMNQFELFFEDFKDILSA